MINISDKIYINKENIAWVGKLKTQNTGYGYSIYSFEFKLMTGEYINIECNPKIQSDHVPEYVYSPMWIKLYDPNSFNILREQLIKAIQ